MTRRSVVASTGLEKRTRTPPLSISSVPGRIERSASAAALRGVLARSLSLSATVAMPATQSGTKTGASPIALRRQVSNNPRLTPNRRATSATFTPGRVLSATFAVFSSLVHRRRRTGPVITRAVAMARRLNVSPLGATLAPITVSELLRAALAARAHWLTVEWLAKYAPELNDIEVVWHDLKAHHLAHQTITDIGALDTATHTAIEDLNRERMLEPLAELRISA